MLEKIYYSLPLHVVSEIITSVILFIIFTVVERILKKLVTKRAEENQFDVRRILFIKSAVRMVTWGFFLIALAMVWNISLKGISIYLASIFTVLGVGLFANWSMVSNITASVILFFFFPFKIGSRVRIMDGDNSVEGLVVGISLFSIHIKTENGNEVYYPNNLAMQKSIVDLD